MRLKPPVASTGTGYNTAMHSDMESQTSSLVSNERQLVVYLQLTSLSGEEYQVIFDLQEFDRFDEFETAVLEQLPTIGGTSTFGCELTFVRQDTGQLLCSPVWDTLRDCNHFQIVVRQCSQSVCRAQRPDEKECKSTPSPCHPFRTGAPPRVHTFE